MGVLGFPHATEGPSALPEDPRHSRGNLVTVCVFVLLSFVKKGGGSDPPRRPGGPGLSQGAQVIL